MGNACEKPVDAGTIDAAPMETVIPAEEHQGLETTPLWKTQAEERAKLVAEADAKAIEDKMRKDEVERQAEENKAQKADMAEGEQVVKADPAPKAKAKAKMVEQPAEENKAQKIDAAEGEQVAKTDPAPKAKAKAKTKAKAKATAKTEAKAPAPAPAPAKASPPPAPAPAPPLTPIAPVVSEVSKELPVAMAFHPNGVYTIDKGGKQSSLSGEGHWFATVAIPVSDEELLMCHHWGLYKTNVKTGKSNKLSEETWGDAKVLLRCKADPGSVLCLHSHGTYRINIASGKYEKLSGGMLGLSAGWQESKAAIYDPTEDCGYVFHTNGMYKFNTKDGTYSQIGSSWSGGWHEAKAAVWHKTGAWVFHSLGTYHVDLKTGKYTKHGDCWTLAAGAALLNSDTAIVVHAQGIYEVKLDKYACRKLDSSTWLQVACVTGLGASVMASHHTGDDDHHHDHW